jgi:GNAT superfamily N-acetyltransferase
MLSEGYHDLPQGHLAALVTYLRHDLVVMPPLPIWPQGVVLARLGATDLGRYRALFRAVGTEWLWFGRLRLDDEALAAILGHPDYLAFALTGPTGDIGLLELDCRSMHEPELAYFGLVPGEIGRGFGRELMAEALHRAALKGARHLMVHTCTFDAPGALGFYQRAGFRPYRRAIESFRDPRLDGTLPREAAAHVPIIEF